MLLHYLVKYLSSKDCHVQGVIEANYLSGKISKKSSHPPYKTSHDRLDITAVTEKKMLQQMAVHDQQTASQ